MGSRKSGGSVLEFNLGPPIVEAPICIPKGPSAQILGLLGTESEWYLVPKAHYLGTWALEVAVETRMCVDHTFRGSLHGGTLHCSQRPSSPWRLE